MRSREIEVEPVDDRDWKPWYAWHPVRVSVSDSRYVWVWREHLERRRIVPLFEFGYWIYRWPDETTGPTTGPGGPRTC